MKDTEIQTLRNLFVELVNEFNARQQELIPSVNIHAKHAFRVGNVSAPGVLRGASSHSVHTDDLKLLDQLHAYGSVRNLKDRRTDFYQVTRTK